jgi:hypothetical protein
LLSSSSCAADRDDSTIIHLAVAANVETWRIKFPHKPSKASNFTGESCIAAHQKPLIVLEVHRFAPFGRDLFRFSRGDFHST